MNPELPIYEDTVNKLYLIKEEILQFIANPKYKKFTDEILTLKNFLSGKGSSIEETICALKDIGEYDCSLNKTEFSSSWR